jgi:transposase
LDWRAKVELFEQIRREYEFGVGTIQGVSRKLPPQKPKRVIADRGYDSDPRRERLKKRGIELIAPYRKNNKQRRYEDGRKLRRYKRRWIVEPTNSWLGQFRRLLVRHEHLLSTYCAFFYLACLWITLRHYF